MNEESKNIGKKGTRRKRKKKAIKGALIKGMSKRLPSEILDNPVFKKRLREIMKGYSGIYAYLLLLAVSMATRQTLHQIQLQLSGQIHLLVELMEHFQPGDEMES